MQYCKWDKEEAVEVIIYVNCYINSWFSARKAGWKSHECWVCGAYYYYWQGFTYIWRFSATRIFTSAEMKVKITGECAHDNNPLPCSHWLQTWLNKWKLDVKEILPKLEEEVYEGLSVYQSMQKPTKMTNSTSTDVTLYVSSVTYEGQWNPTLGTKYYVRARRLKPRSHWCHCQFLLVQGLTASNFVYFR